MNLISQSFEFISQKDFSLKGIRQFIERCGRVCYKSEDRITDSSYEKFVDMLISKNHSRPLEFGTVHLKIPLLSLDSFIQKLALAGIYNDMWLKYNVYGDYAYATTNYRYWLDICQHFSSFKAFFTEEDGSLFPKRATVHFVTNRAIMDEFRTHVSLSHLAESTRYCSYDKGRFNGQLTFIMPSWFRGPSGEYSKEDICLGKEGDLIANFLNAEEDYMLIRQNGASAQEARDVLPLGIKSELVSCGFISAWKNFFYRRCDSAAHPMAKQLADGLHASFASLGLLS